MTDLLPDPPTCSGFLVALPFPQRSRPAPSWSSTELMERWWAHSSELHRGRSGLLWVSTMPTVNMCVENLCYGTCVYRSMVSTCTHSVGWVLILPFPNYKKKFLRRHGLYTFGIKMKPYALFSVSKRAGQVKDYDSECQYTQMLTVKSRLLRMPFFCVYCQAPFCHKQDPLE